MIRKTSQFNGIRKWSTLNRISKDPKRRAKRIVPPSSIREVKKRSGGICECYIMEDGTPCSYQFMIIHPELTYKGRCRKRATRTPHHVLPRGRGGKHEPSNLLDVDWFICHTWINNNPRLAVQRGLLKEYEGQQLNGQ